MTKTWSAGIKDGRLYLRNGKRLPRKLKKFVKNVLELTGSEDYILMSISLAKEYDRILSLLKENDGRATETV